MNHPTSPVHADLPASSAARPPTPQLHPLVPAAPSEAGPAAADTTASLLCALMQQAVHRGRQQRQHAQAEAQALRARNAHD